MTCKVCYQPIKIMCFIGTAYCCENHRKILDGDYDIAPSPR